MNQEYTEEQRVTLSGEPAKLPNEASAPDEIDPKNGMHKDYWILSDEGRAKKRIRPLRFNYTHVGKRSKYPLRDLTAEEKERYHSSNYVRFEEYPESESPVTGRFWTQEALDKQGACGASTRMHERFAETYAVNPTFYGATFCSTCGEHFPVSEFVWDDTDVLVGS